LIKINIILRRD